MLLGHSVHPSPGSQFLEGEGGGGSWERGGDFFQGGCSFYTKNKLKSQIFHDKKSLSAKMFFSVITNNFLKNGIRLRMKKF